MIGKNRASKQISRSNSQTVLLIINFFELSVKQHRKKHDQTQN